LGEYLDGIRKFFHTEFELSEHSSSQLSSYLVGVSSLESNLMTVRASNEAENAAQAERSKASKRERSPDADAMADVAGTPTSVAASEPDEAAAQAVRALQEQAVERLQAAASSSTPAPLVSSTLDSSTRSAETPGTAPLPRPVGPIGTTPHDVAQTAPTRAERERSPRRDGALIVAAVSTEDSETQQLTAEQQAAAAQPCDTLDSLDSVTPQLTAAQCAALRGDDIGNGAESEEDDLLRPPQPPQTQPSNARGGAPPT
jgi:hypothetical protein